MDRTQNKTPLQQVEESEQYLRDLPTLLAKLKGDTAALWTDELADLDRTQPHLKQAVRNDIYRSLQEEGLIPTIPSKRVASRRPRIFV